MGDKEKAFALFDAYNQQDPRQVTYEGNAYPLEYFLSRNLYDWVRKLSPGSDETLLLASRCQHIGRWEIPRSNYPGGRNGYFRWRKALAGHHAEIAASLLRQAGYGEAEITAVQQILRKEHMRTDPRAQIMEDALCLVFLAHQYEDFRQNQGEEKVVNILKKTWDKMSEAGRKAAMDLSYTEAGAALISRAIPAA